jgi:hypothetical protein
MKRFNIRNKVNGQEFMIERKQLGELQPEWGKPNLDDSGQVIYGVDGLPQSDEFEITATDLTAEIEAEKAAKLEKAAKREARKARLNALEAELDAETTIAGVKKALKKILKDLHEELQDRS